MPLCVDHSQVHDRARFLAFYDWLNLIRVETDLPVIMMVHSGSDCEDLLIRDKLDELPFEFNSLRIILPFVTLAALLRFERRCLMSLALDKYPRLLLMALPMVVWPKYRSLPVVQSGQLAWPI